VVSCGILGFRTSSWLSSGLSRDIVGCHQCCHSCAVDCPWVRRLADNVGRDGLHGPAMKIMKRHKRPTTIYSICTGCTTFQTLAHSIHVYDASKNKSRGRAYVQLLTAETHTRKPQEFLMFLYFDCQVPLFDAVCSEECNARSPAYQFLSFWLSVDKRVVVCTM
jgi:hypothetical protein